MEARIFLSAIAGILTLALAGGCGLITPTGVEPPPALPQAAPSQPKEQVELPGLIVSEIEDRRKTEQLFSFSLRDASIRSALFALAKQTSFNIVVDPDVDGKVTVDLKNVTLTEALDLLTDLIGLSYGVKNNIIRVSRPAMEGRLFYLQYVHAGRTGSSSTSAQIGTGTGAAPGGAASGGGGGGGGQSITTSSNVDIWKQVEDGLPKLVSEKGKVVVDRNAGAIFVTDFPKVLNRIAQFLEAVEGSIHRQVLIEARILEVTLTEEFKLGLDWGAIAKAGVLKGKGASPISQIGRATQNIFGQNLNPRPGGFQIGVANENFAFLLDAIAKQGKIDIISSPKISTLNNQTAIIRVGTDAVFFETRVVAATTTAPESRTVTPRSVTVGVVLGVTPQIAPDGSVVLHIRPTVTEQRGEARSSVGDTFPIIDVREVDTVVRAREGQLIVIAGLMQEKKSRSEDKVPLLGDIPGLGRLFRGTSEEKRKTELVILLSPTVLVGKKIDEITSQDLERINKKRAENP